MSPHAIATATHTACAAALQAATEGTPLHAMLAEAERGARAELEALTGSVR